MIDSKPNGGVQIGNTVTDEGLLEVGLADEPVVLPSGALTASSRQGPGRKRFKDDRGSRR